MWGLYLDHSSSSMGHTCMIWEAFVQGHMPVMRNIHISVFMVTFLIAVGSYEAHELTWLSHVHMNQLAYVAVCSL